MLVQQGIMLIADILTTEYKLPTLTQLSVKFNLAWQEYTYDKLISVIPIEWRTLIQSNTTTTFIQYQPLLYTVKSIKRKATKFFYTALMKQHITQTQKTINKWKRDLHMDEIDNKWETICSQIYYIIPVKLKSFYFKFIHRALPCNYTLYKMKITQITADFVTMSQRPLCICSGNVPMWKSCGKQFGTLFLYSQQKILTPKCVILYYALITKKTKSTP